jgi:hypothetical protein
VPCEAAEEFNVFGHAADVNLKEGKAILERCELLKELFLSQLVFRKVGGRVVIDVETIPFATVGDIADHVHFSLLSRSGAPMAQTTDRLTQRSLDCQTGGVYDRRTSRHDQNTGF